MDVARSVLRAPAMDPQNMAKHTKLVPYEGFDCMGSFSDYNIKEQFLIECFHSRDLVS